MHIHQAEGPETHGMPFLIAWLWHLVLLPSILGAALFGFLIIRLVSRDGVLPLWNRSSNVNGVGQFGCSFAATTGVSVE